MPRADGPFKLIEYINDNAYKVDLPVDYGVSATFNVVDMSPYLDDDYLTDLRAILLKKERMMEEHPYYHHMVLMELKGVKEAQNLKVQTKTCMIHPLHTVQRVVQRKNTQFCVLNFLVHILIYC